MSADNVLVAIKQTPATFWKMYDVSFSHVSLSKPEEWREVIERDYSSIQVCSSEAEKEQFVHNYMKVNIVEYGFTEID